MGTKIVTCCYCGTKAALVLAGKSRHELTCANCGAPLHDMKMLRADATRDHPKATVKKEKYKTKGVTPNPIWERELPRKTKKKKSKKKKSFARAFFEEAFDVIEDILD